jgi:predicted dehydrogenase
MSDKIRIGCIGVGQIGKHHLDNYAKVPGAELVAIADVNAAELERVGEAYGIPHRFTDFRKLLERDDIQAVDVCLHNNLHQPVTVAALEAGKHVYCEKPMAGSYIDAEAMYSKAQESGLKLSIQARLLFVNETRAARAIIDQGLLGRCYHARSYGFRRRGRPYVDGYGTPTFVQKEVASGGALYDMGVYHIMQMLYLLDNPQPLGWIPSAAPPADITWRNWGWASCALMTTSLWIFSNLGPFTWMVLRVPMWWAVRVGCGWIPLVISTA